jgi:hypothetical protein
MANKEVLIIIRVDGVEKEIKSLDDLKEAVKQLGDEQKKSAEKTSFFGEKLKDLKKFFGDLKNDAKGLYNDFVGFAKGLGISEKAAKGLAFGLSALGLPILLTVIAAVIEYFKNFEAGVRLVTKVTNALGDAVGQITKSFQALFSGDFKGFINGILGIGDAVKESLEATDALFDTARQLAELTEQNTVANAKLNSELKKAQKIVSDGTATYEERVAALKKIEEVEQQLLKNQKAEIELQKQNLQAQLTLENNYAEQLKIKQQIAGLTAQQVELETELSVKSGQAAKKIREIDIQRTKDAEEQAKKRLEIERKFQDDKIKLAQEIELLETSNEREKQQKRLQFDLTNELEALKRAEGTERQKGELRLQIQEKFLIQQKQLEDSFAKEDQKRIDDIIKGLEKKKVDTIEAKLEELKAEEDNKIKELELLKASETEKEAVRKAFLDKRNEIEEENQIALKDILEKLELDSIADEFRKAEREIEIEKNKAIEKARIRGASAEELNQIEQLYSDKRKLILEEEAVFNAELAKEEQEMKIGLLTGALNTISNILGENSKVGKAAAIASAVIDTYVGANKAIAQGGIAGVAAAAGVIATGLANVKKIVQTKSPLDKGGEATPTIQAPQAVAFDPRLALGQASISPNGANSLNQQAAVNVKAYVVSSEMTSTQEADRKLQNISRL